MWLLVGGLGALWLINRLPSWRALSREGIWAAERDYARWRLRNGLILLGMILTLIGLTLYASIRA